MVKVRKSKKPGTFTILCFVVAPAIATIGVMVWLLMTPNHNVNKWGNLPQVLVLDGHTGRAARFVNGEYELQPRKLNDRPTWVKRERGLARAPVAYILYSRCGEWLISQHHNGHGKECNGWVKARGCGTDGPDSGPWECQGHWLKWGSQDAPARGLLVSREPGPAALDRCTKTQEAALAAAVSDIDLVVLWVNGSEPTWLRRREKACQDFMRRLWPDAVRRSSEVQDCLRKAGVEPDQVQGSFEGAKCGMGEETCTASPQGNLPEAAQGCFEQFSGDCRKRVHSIGDHDELRYLLRSLERQLSWHKGRILLVVPRQQQPIWLRTHGRLQLVAQEDILQAALKSPHFVLPNGRSAPAYAPEEIYNDEPILAALPFLPGASRIMMVFQDDILLPRPVGACELLTRPPSAGLRVFGNPVESEMPADPYDRFYRSHQATSAQFWERHVREQAAGQGSDSGPGTPSPYYEPQHVPWLVDTDVLREFWRRWPAEMSNVVDAPFRHPNLTNIIGLHNSEIALRAREARSAPLSYWKRLSWAWQAFWPSRWLDANVVARARVSNMEDPGQKQVKEVVLGRGSEEEWRDAMQDIFKAQITPAVLSIQDDFGQQASREQECLREQWMNKLLPKRSSWEDHRHPPAFCKGPKDLFPLP